MIIRPGDGIGRHTGLKILGLLLCGFKSRSGYKGLIMSYTKTSRLACLKLFNYNKKDNPAEKLLVDYKRYLKLQLNLRLRRRELLVFCEHPPTISSGVQAQPQNLLLREEELADRKILCFKVGRGGDYTAHEPGQCLIYPHLDLKKRKIGIRDYIDALLSITIKAIQKVWGLESYSNAKMPGLYWGPTQAKIAAIGIMFKNYFTSFGLSLNISNSLKTFNYINPCGFEGLSATSIEDCLVNLPVTKDSLDNFIDYWQSEFEKWLSITSKSR